MRPHPTTTARLLTMLSLAVVASPACFGSGGGDDGGVMASDANVTPDIDGPGADADPQDTTGGQDTTSGEDSTQPDGATPDTTTADAPDTSPPCPPTPCVTVGVSCLGNAQLSCSQGPDGCLSGVETACLDASGAAVACDSFTGECVQSCTGTAPATNSAPDGALRLELTDVVFDSATVTVKHKRDVDPFEDGCIAEVTVRLEREGCTLTARTDGSPAEADPDGHLIVNTLAFSANSACPGFPDPTEGDYIARAGTPYTATGNNLGVIAFGTDRVPGQDVASSCFVSTMELRLYPSTALADGSKDLEVLPTTITLAGEFTSTGDVDEACPCRAYASQRCATTVVAGDASAIATEWVNTCGQSNGVKDTCVGNEICSLGTSTAGTDTASCLCPGHWEGAGCDVCPGNWDPAQGCNACRNGWTGSDCEVCPGNFDESDDCGSCRNAWTGNDCTTCPVNFDPASDCATCRNHWSGADCNTCPDAVDESTDCADCKIEWGSGAPHDYPGCFDVVRGYSLGGAEAKKDGTALGPDGRLYVATEGGIIALDADRNVLWTSGGNFAIAADDAVYAQSFLGFSRLDANGSTMWSGDFSELWSAGRPSLDAQSRLWTTTSVGNTTEVTSSTGATVATYDAEFEQASAFALDEGGEVIYRPVLWRDPDGDDPNTAWFEWQEGPRVQAVRVSDGEVLWQLQRPTLQNDTHLQISARAGGGVMLADTWGFLVLDAQGNEIFEPDANPFDDVELTVGEDGSIYGVDGNRIRRWSATGSLIYDQSFTNDGHVRTPTVAADGSAYVSLELYNGAQGLVAFEPNGDLRWAYTTPEVCSDPIIDDDAWLWSACGGWLIRMKASAPLADSVWPRYRGGNGNTGR